MFGASSEPASVMEFGFNRARRRLTLFIMHNAVTVNISRTAQHWPRAKSSLSVYGSLSHAVLCLCVSSTSDITVSVTCGVRRVSSDDANARVLFLATNVPEPCLHSATCKDFITFCVSRRRRKMYCGHARLCVCVCVCLCVRGRTPTLLHGPGCNLGAW